MQKNLVILITTTVIFSQILFLLPSVDFGFTAKLMYLAEHLLVAVVLSFCVARMVLFKSELEEFDAFLLCLHRCSFISFVNVLFLFSYGLLIIQYNVKDSLVTSNSLRVALCCCQLLSMTIYMKSLQMQRLYFLENEIRQSWAFFPPEMQEPLPIYRSKDDDLPNYASQISSD